MFSNSPFFVGSTHATRTTPDSKLTLANLNVGPRGPAAVFLIIVIFYPRHIPNRWKRKVKPKSQPIITAN